jgi:hypothetical protein
MKRLDLTGQRFNKLTAVCFDSVYDQRTMWKFLCDCGKLTIACATQVKAGGTKSCGCLLNMTHPGYNRLPDGEAAFNELFSNYKYSAKKRSIPFDLTEQQFRYFINKNCTYCGTEPLQKNVSHNTTSAYSFYLYNGLDRSDNNKGYTEDNVVPCCKICNYAKHTMHTDQFKQWIDRLVKFQNSERDAKSIGLD